MPQLESVLVEERDDGRVITHSWFNSYALLVLPVCVFWDLVVPAAIVLWQPDGAALPWPLLAALLMIVVATGAWSTMGALAGVLNQTTIRVEEDILSIRHDPIPWMRNRTIPVSAIWQFFTQIDSPSALRRGPHLHVLLRNGRSLRLLPYLPGVHEAESISRRLEQILGIEHQPAAIHNLAQRWCPSLASDASFQKL
jgi:hypothetical protein